jgi:energy-coupling factor transport system ATP-binding protein
VVRGEPAALELRGLRFGFDERPVFDEVDLRVEPGEVVALMGRNGSGKSTLLRLIMGLLRPSGGSIIVAGRTVSRLATAEIARLVGYVPQRPGLLLSAETVGQELGLAPTPQRGGQPIGRGWPAAARQQTEAGQRAEGSPTATEALARLEALGLVELLDRYPGDLSLGEQQRLALALALAGRPGLLLLDEPTRGLDGAAKGRLVELLNGLRQAGLAIVVATHDVELVAGWVDRVVLLGDGMVVADAAPRQVLAGSLTLAPQINRLFGGQYLTLADVLPAGSVGS